MSVNQIELSESRGSIREECSLPQVTRKLSLSDISLEEINNKTEALVEDERVSIASGNDEMVSYYNPAVAMFGRSGSAGHHHHHHPSPSQNHYFTPAYSGYHPHHHQPGAPAPASAVAATQFSPNMSTDFNCSHQYHHQFGNMSPETMPAAAWHQPMYRNIVSGYEEWSHPHPPPTHPSFYHGHGGQNTPPSSSSSPNSSHTSNNNHSPTLYNSNNTASFKSEFTPCSGGNPQENTHDIQSGPVVTSSGATTIGTPHSPDSGMAISDGVSSSNGSPATGGSQQQHCLPGTHHLTSNVTSLNSPSSIIGSQSSNLNVNQQSIHPGRPAQARSPYEWMKKPSYNISSNNSGKTRTKDKYRVVYSDTQRLELEKEFHYNRYITIRRKTDLASNLGLSERQVKIWFQNRRAKERKMLRKRDEMVNRGNNMEKYAMQIHIQNAVSAGGMQPLCNPQNGVSTIPALM